MKPREPYRSVLRQQAERDAVRAAAETERVTLEQVRQERIERAANLDSYRMDGLDPDIVKALHSLWRSGAREQFVLTWRYQRALVDARREGAQ